MQIKNLSAAQVQTFGEILSANPEQLPPSVERWQIHPGDMVKEMRTDDPVVLDYVSGMPLLVIYEGDMQSVYYLDRYLCCVQVFGFPSLHSETAARLAAARISQDVCSFSHAIRRRSFPARQVN